MTGANRKTHLLITHPPDKAIWGNSPCGAKGWKISYSSDRVEVTCKKCLSMTAWSLKRFLKYMSDCGLKDDFLRV